MTGQHQLDDLDLAALISSRICHDVISPVGAIANGLEVLDEENDEQVREYAMDLIRRSAGQASAKLQFARLAYGAGGSAGAEIGLTSVEEVANGILDPEKHSVSFLSEPQSLSKDKVKLLLNLFAISITTIPRGGSINIEIKGEGDAPHLTVRSTGEGARTPERLNDIMAGRNGFELDSMSIQHYYTVRIASEAAMALDTASQGDDIVLTAQPAN